MADVRVTNKKRQRKSEIPNPSGNSPAAGRFALPAVIFIAVFAHIAAIHNFFTADSWVFVHPRSFGETFRYFFTSILPPTDEAYWFRPIPMFTFWFENLVLPRTFWLPHLTNIIFHALNVFLVWRITEFMLAPKGPRTASTTFAGATAGLIYGIHPLTVGSVAWVAARFDVMSVTFGLAGLLFWLRWDAGIDGKRSFWLAAGLLLCSILSKEPGVVFLLTAFSLTLFRAILPGSGRRISWTGLAIPVVLAAACLTYRFVLFGNIGGYVTPKQVLSFGTSLKYLAAIFYPWRNTISGWHFSPAFWIALAGIGFLGLLLRNSPAGSVPRLRREYFLAVLVFLALGLLTTMPKPYLSLHNVLGHAEARYALIPVTAFALLAGIAVSRLRTKTAYSAALAMLLIWGSFSAWRTTVQVQAWKSSGVVAKQIVAETLHLVPYPQQNSTIILCDIPTLTTQYAYIFGIGLDYALKTAYGREDIRVIRFPTNEDIAAANPSRDAVLIMNSRTRHLERIAPR